MCASQFRNLGTRAEAPPEESVSDGGELPVVALPEEQPEADPEVEPEAVAEAEPEEAEQEDGAVGLLQVSPAILRSILSL